MLLLYFQPLLPIALAAWLWGHVVHRFAALKIDYDACFSPKDRKYLIPHGDIYRVSTVPLPYSAAVPLLTPSLHTPCAHPTSHPAPVPLPSPSPCPLPLSPPSTSSPWPSPLWASPARPCSWCPQRPGPSWSRTWPPWPSTSWLCSSSWPPWTCWRAPPGCSSGRRWRGCWCRCRRSAGRTSCWQMCSRRSVAAAGTSAGWHARWSQVGSRGRGVQGWKGSGRVLGTPIGLRGTG